MEGDEIGNSEVLRSNAEFYHAFEGLSIEMMDTLWKHDEKVICIHPGWDLFVGWLAIRESWVAIFQHIGPIKFNITNTRVRIFESCNTAMVVCQENIESSVNGQLQRTGVIATNLYERNEKQWLLIHHHGSSISNYILPNISP